MSILFIEEADNKFVNNVKLTKDSKRTLISGTRQKVLYQLYYSYKFTHIIFMSSLLDVEAYQFISEYHSLVKCYIYCDTIYDKEYLEKYENIATCILQKKSNKLPPNYILLPKLVNKELFSHQSTQEKKSDIVCFIDNLNTIPENLNRYLYPKTKLPIKLFNNPNIKHHQNLGILSEIEKATVLKNSMFYLTIDEHYLAEAWESGCNVLTVPELDLLISKKYKTKKYYQTYSSFMEQLTDD
jgi:hypothetical protein